MKRISIMLALLLTTIPTLAHATPTKDAKAHVATAKQNLATARAELKASKAHDRAEKRATGKARKMARVKAQLAKLQAKSADLGCGTCVDTHDGACTCLPEDSEPAGEPTFNQPDEGTCRRIALKGESWEDACERVFSIAPSAWGANGRLVTTDPAGY